MINTDPKEMATEIAGDIGPFGRFVALVIAIMAVILAVAGVGGDNASEDAVNANIEASNLWAFFQAKTIRQTSYKLANDELTLQRELNLISGPKVDSLMADYQRKIDEYDSEPDKGEGRRELMARAQEAEAIRDAALRKNNFFDLAGTVLQVAIVLASVSILANTRWIFGLSAVGALAGAAITAYAFVLA